MGPVGAISEPAAASSASWKSWMLMAYAAALGVFGAGAGLLSLGTIKLAGEWGTDFDPGWLGGHWWWVAVTAAAGRRGRRATAAGPACLRGVPGLFDDLRADDCRRRDWSPGTVAVSAVSLVGGASVGPEKVLASVGGGAGS